MFLHYNFLSYLLFKHCISYAAVHTNDKDFTQQDGVVNKQLRLDRIVCSLICVCVCVRVCVPTTKHGIIVLEQGLREIFVLKREGVA